MFIIFFMMLIPLVIYFHFYFQRIISFLCHIKKSWEYILSWIFAIIFVLPAYNLFSFWAVVVLHLFVFSLLTDLVIWLVAKKNIPQSINKIYHLGLIPVLCLLILIGYSYIHMQDVKVVNYNITTQKQLSKNYKVAFISDLHFPNTMNEEKLQTYCQEISKEKPDIVLLGGDIVDERTSLEDMQHTFDILSTIESRYGIYYVYGNHDQALYARHPAFTPDELKQAIENNQIKVLCDEKILINNEIVLIGRDDRSHQRASLQTLIQGTSSTDFLLVLDHQPVDLETNDLLQVDLQMSGHTHGGQMFPVGILSQWLGFGEVNYGYRQLSHMQVLVSSGIAGWGYPLRTGSQSEYLIVNIQNN